MNLLGDTLEKIAVEKAGIIKKNIPIVIGEVLPETKHVFQLKATDESAPLLIAQEERKITSLELGDFLRLQVVDKNEVTNTYELDLKGIYQQKNLLTVLTAIEELRKRKLVIDEKAVRKALRTVQKLTGLAGRWQILQHRPNVVADVGHNEDGMKQIIQQLQLYTYQKLHIVLGMVKDKDVDKVLQHLPPAATYYFTKAQIVRALPENELMEKGKTFQLYGSAYPTVNEAISKAIEHAAADDFVLICGSIFLVAEVDSKRWKSAVSAK
jgi:dihydrofolate synthase/folylpolyglutamate synthase